MTSWFSSSFVGQGRVWLDGREVKGLNDAPYIAIGLPSLAPGTSHTLAVEAQNAGVVAGVARADLDFLGAASAAEN